MNIFLINLANILNSINNLGFYLAILKYLYACCTRISFLWTSDPESTVNPRGSRFPLPGGHHNETVGCISWGGEERSFDPSRWHGSQTSPQIVGNVLRRSRALRKWIGKANFTFAEGCTTSMCDRRAHWVGSPLCLAWFHKLARLANSRDGREPWTS